MHVKRNDLNAKSRMKGDFHVRFRERLRVKFPWSTRQGDEVGLFALAGTTTMQEERYVDNLHFIRSSNGEFESNESVFYPDDGVTLLSLIHI